MRCGYICPILVNYTSCGVITTGLCEKALPRLAIVNGSFYLVLMTLYEFSLLPEELQVHEVSEGSYLWFREEDLHIVFLFKVHSFFVEVYCDIQHQQFIRFNSFNALERLGLYFSCN